MPREKPSGEALWHRQIWEHLKGCPSCRVGVRCAQYWELRDLFPSYIWGPWIPS